MKKYFFIIIFVLLSFFISSQELKAANLNFAQKSKGQFFLQVESYGRIWYVNPKDGQRYYFKLGPQAFETAIGLGTKIAQKDLAKIPQKKGDRVDKKIVERLKGYFLISSDVKNQFWYINPSDGLKYSFKNSTELDSLIKKFAVGAKNKQIKLVPMNKTQLVFDTTFNDVAYVRYNGVSFDRGYNADIILPPASMTKLMTALVLIDLNFDFNQVISINQSQIGYPQIYAGDDKTSEINFALGDQVSAKDLFVAMLVASSNQAAITLADATGLTRLEFVDSMNKKAKELGLKKTIFYDASGLDPHNVTTAKEMAIIANDAFDNQKIANTSITREYTIKALDKLNQEKLIPVINRNNSILQYNPDGVKTGYLVEAQRTVSIKKGDKIVVVMHALSSSQKNSVIKKLLN